MAKNTVKISKEEKEHIDNQIVLATAIALVGAMLLLFLQNWCKSIYAQGTMIFVKVLMWLGVAGVAASIIVYFIAKEKRALKFIPYCAASALMFSIIPYGLFGLPITLSTDKRFIILYICLAVYLIATYVVFATKLFKHK